MENHDDGIDQQPVWNLPDAHERNDPLKTRKIYLRRVDIMHHDAGKKKKSKTCVGGGGEEMENDATGDAMSCFDDMKVFEPGPHHSRFSPPETCRLGWYRWIKRDKEERQRTRGSAKQTPDQ